MTRDPDQRPVNPRRQRPLLVISTNSGASTDQQSKGGGQQELAREEKQAVPPAENQAANAAQSRGARRQPGFFASVIRSAEEQERQNLQTDAGKMRLWRALRLRRGQTSESGEASSGERANKTAGETAARGQQQKAMLRNVKKSQSGQGAVNASRSAPTASGGQAAASTTDQASRPLLKTRHFVGLFIYIIVATLLEVPLAYISQVFHLNRILFQFSIFNFPVVITQALVIYLVLLVALLIILNHFDLLPFSRTAVRQEKSAAQSSQGRTRAKGKGKKESNKGEHDHLYEDYRDLRRYLRRRARKR